MSAPGVYSAINKVQAALSKTGIAKDQKNTQGSGYMFRGIDSVYNAISPLLAEHGLCILPRMLARDCQDRQSKSGANLFYVTVEAEFDVVCAEDGSKHTIKTFGEAMDSGDKATNKAMSAAYKYAAFQMFAIPTEGDNDADATTHEVKAKPVASITPNDVGRDYWNNAEGDEKEFLNAELSIIRDCLNADQPADAADRFYKIGSIEEQSAVWSQLGSKERKAIKDNKQQPMKEAA